MPPPPYDEDPPAYDTLNLSVSDAAGEPSGTTNPAAAASTASTE